MRALALSFFSFSIEKRDVSSVESFALDFNSLGEPLMYTRNSRGPKIDR